ncbi:alpha/beta fold hydrolase [Oricola thermophila]|uniref:Alpha/beta hydrolase n=1 Tax=Oricola thermophila TaxID=2742145 RepID=A0A6N1VDR9_9HYPH|nr:alpha/beta hydrolase [Oricola thermophila]QKV19121.1 alpha/beta hydrolase [Oricola thermophila]
MEDQKTQSHIVRVGDRNLHLRILGDGPPVVLLHESPRSSMALMPLASLLAPSFTVLAIDTPGYGLSDPLDIRNAEIEDFADAIASSLRTLGLKRVPVYGTHTGSTIAVSMAVRHPDLVTGVVLDGYPVFSQHERDLHETCYLPQFPPAWDGSHVAALWSRVRDQYDFFPWYLRGNSSRLQTPRPDLARHRAVFRDFLSAGPAYSIAYAASFRFDASEQLGKLNCPFHIIARETDLLHGHLQRLPELPAGASASSCPADPVEWKLKIERLLHTMPGDKAPPGFPEPSRVDGGTKVVMDGWLFLGFHGNTGSRNPLVLLHDLPGSGNLMADEARRRSDDGLVIVPELPGCGITEVSGSGRADLARLATLLERTLDIADAERAEVEGTGLSLDIAKALAGMSPRLEAAENRGGPVPRASVPDAPLPPRWDGADLMAAWYETRETELARVQSVGGVAGMDLDRLHAAFVAWYLSEDNYRSLKSAAEQLTT